jgi:hypothetical protein
LRPVRSVQRAAQCVWLGVYKEDVLGRRAGIVLVGVVATAAIGMVAAASLLLVHRTDLPLERAFGDAIVTTVAGLLGGDAKNPLAGNARAIDAGR